MKSITPLFCSLAAGLLLAGCAGDSGTLTSADLKAFDAGKPELKLAWTDALAMGKTNNYLGAILSLRELTKQGLETDQLVAVQNALRTYNLALNNAAAKGDPAAVKAAEQLHSLGRRPGR